MFVGAVEAKLPRSPHAMLLHRPRPLPLLPLLLMHRKPVKA
jgi:hypothetical protein